MTSAKSSYWKMFRIFFVLFMLYLLRDTFFRWDGFKYYASFSEFLPSFALITILWTIITAFAALLIWIPIRIFEWYSMRMGWKISLELLMLIMGIFFIFGIGAAAGKIFIWNSINVTPFLLMAVVSCSLAAAVFIALVFRHKADKWINYIQGHITPIVWLFVIWFVISVPVVTYHTWIKAEESTVVSQITGKSIAKPNIILVTFDALTARNMSVNGYERPTTPFMQKWAEEASVFTKTEAESNYTTPAVASLMTGKRIWTHQTFHLGGSKPINSKTESVPFLLKKSGYYNVAFVMNPVASVNTLGMENSFDITFKKSNDKPSFSFSSKGPIKSVLDHFFSDKIRMHDWLIKHDFIISKLVRNLSSDYYVTRTPPEKAFNKFLETIDNSPSEPLFAWIHLFPPHLPYLPPEPFIGMFDSSSKLRSFRTQMKARGKAFKEPKHVSFSAEMKPGVELLRARYDEFVRYCDKQFEDFIAELSKRNKLDNTIVILSSDHGESFEHGFLEHIGHSLYEPVTNIPLIIKDPDNKDGMIINEVVEQIDISATILDLAGIDSPPWMEGRSLVPLMRGKKLPPRPAFSVYLEKNRSLGQRITTGVFAVWQDEYKLIHDLKTKTLRLYNLEKDPSELENLAEKEPEISHRLLNLIQDNLAQANRKIVEGQ